MKFVPKKTKCIVHVLLLQFEKFHIKNLLVK